MGKRTAWLLVFIILMIVTAPQDIAAQSLFSRLFKKGGIGLYFKHKKATRHRRHYCGEMDAYNKRKAYKRHKKSRSRGLFAKRSTAKSERKTVAQTKADKKLTSSPPATVTSKSQPKQPSQQPPKKTLPEQPAPAPDSPPVAKKSPAEPGKPNRVRVEKKSKPLLTRTELKKMTETERRDTLRQMEPEIALEPIQFISNQDEFSVVNMDSFMQAMEYAQQGKIVLVEGHTDDIGRESYNLDLSMKRAEKIRELLLSGGVSDELISVIGYGESRPLLPNTSDENRAINRRIEFKIFSLQE